ncbi:hypothetical protein SPRG_09580 [Saprolegnia parasitica CBS 223.65]|uniref:DOMON domain-containing protein n=1 Tax=Saprolegnia parasitica (strain CBS 223.65) TaxID=695850 RepID=A0A067CEF4_SAPPC|nr:hypothetical protein SPRG_09580 [Saprolegnia parasitica CBS 223.65]KDO24936.1 hypothetical protein SPRG_09580 [Saprolegnia parasitica CBS 223.65]|eukprot:XP_012204396.1 hypothetical protein SPRG_09580 [Saprolegnia parasitica CBS 223.65]
MHGRRLAYLVATIVASALGHDACGEMPTTNPPPVGPPCLFAKNAVVTLKADNDDALSACSNCVKDSKDFSVFLTSVKSNTWTIQQLDGNNLISLHANGFNGIDNNVLAPSMNRAPGVVEPDQVMLPFTVEGASSAHQWTCTQVSYNQIMLRNVANGKYLARCDGCDSDQIPPADLFQPVFTLASPHGNHTTAPMVWTYTLV